MTQDEITRMAQGYEPTFTWAQLQAAVLAEREACAKVCERLISGDGICADDGVWIHDCAAAIRARSNHG